MWLKQAQKQILKSNIHLKRLEYFLYAKRLLDETEYNTSTVYVIDRRNKV